jgi:CubicO group peptidase (beta-lactamase class C family)
VNGLTPTQSAHKSVLAMVVGLAIAEGHINSVDDSASLYLTEWANDERREITIRQMLQQSSGINFATFGINPLGGFFQLMLGDDVTPAALDLPQEVPAGSRFDYNSAIPQNMGLLIQRATGQRYADYLSAALWQKLGIPDAFLVLDSEEKRMPRTSCCLDATARSWLRLGLLHLDQGRVGNRQVIPAQWMRDIVTPSEHNPNYGYFTWLGNRYDEYRYYNRKTSTRVFHSEPFAAPDVAFFDGFGGQRVYIIPSQRLVIVRTGRITPAWDDAYLPNTIIRGLPK